MESGKTMTGMTVCKFGGTSVANSEQIKKVAGIIKSDKKRKIIVTSAPKGVTDLLIECANEFHESKRFPDFTFKKVKEIYDEIGENLELKDFAGSMLDELKNRVYFPIENKKDYADYIKSWGEYSNAKIISAYLNRIGIESRFGSPKEVGLYVSQKFGDARVLEESYENIRKNLRGLKEVLLFPGFYGMTKTDKYATFTRGGSDLTGSLLAASVGASVYENWTDQDGIRNADPKVVKTPMQIKEITYKEIRELAYMGFKVFHAEAMIPAMTRGIPIKIKNTNNPKEKGTLIANKRKLTKTPIIGVAAKNDFCVFNVEKLMMDKEVGFGRRLLEIFESEEISYEHSPSGIDSVSVILDQTQLDKELVEKIKEKIMEELHPDNVTVEYDKCLISVVGDSLKAASGVISRITGALAKKKINIEMINQGASEISTILGLDKKDCDAAVNAIYNEFFK
ncbi:aspartate kinase [Candidatus Woesearchaeota archaeon]|nr:aspartate kinase [Candidatus Woesearchaeota archaeon]